MKHTLRAQYLSSRVIEDMCYLACLIDSGKSTQLSSITCRIFGRPFGKVLGHRVLHLTSVSANQKWLLNRFNRQLLDLVVMHNILQNGPKVLPFEEGHVPIVARRKPN